MLPSAVRTGLEPATPGVTGRYSNQLNYRTILFRLMRFSRTRMQRYAKNRYLQIFCVLFLKKVLFHLNYLCFSCNLVILQLRNSDVEHSVFDTRLDAVSVCRVRECECLA